jgi:25S rRNA (cytosine2278-C5)-methyltransferase
VLLYDLLLGQGVKPNGGTERLFLKHAPRFHEEASQLLAEASVDSLSMLLTPTSHTTQRRPQRYLRVNTILTSVNDVASLLHKPPAFWPDKHRDCIDIIHDPHLSDVLSIPGARDMHDHPLVLSGEIVLQGKSSCMPAHALQAQPGWHVVDCCAAPGNKTTHVAAFVRTAGTVFAFEKDARRCKLLADTLKRTGTTNVEVQQGVRFVDQ